MLVQQPEEPRKVRSQKETEEVEPLHSFVLLKIRLLKIKPSSHALSNLKPPAAFSGETSRSAPHHNNTKQQQQQPQEQQQNRGLNCSASQHAGPRRQENLRWASELSVVEGSGHWQEQVDQLQTQLDFSNSMCQTLLQDQQVGALNH